MSKTPRMDAEPSIEIEITSHCSKEVYEIKGAVSRDFARALELETVALKAELETQTTIAIGRGELLTQAEACIKDREEKLARVTAERDVNAMQRDQNAHSECEADALRARVAELEGQLDRETRDRISFESGFGRYMDKLAESRSIESDLQQRNAELEAALREIASKADIERGNAMELKGIAEEALTHAESATPAKHPDAERLQRLGTLGNVAIWHGSFSHSHPDATLAGGPVIEILRMDDDCIELIGDGEPIAAGRTLSAAIDAAARKHGGAE